MDKTNAREQREKMFIGNGNCWHDPKKKFDDCPECQELFREEIGTCPTCYVTDLAECQDCLKSIEENIKEYRTELAEMRKPEKESEK